MRLQKALAHSGVASRRRAEEYIREGRVKVNGQVVNEMGVVVTANDNIEVDGKPIKLESKKVYILCINLKDILHRSVILKEEKPLLTLLTESKNVFIL